jgi:anti-anti-sigma factor
MITQSILNQEYSDYFEFENRGDLCIVKIKLLRASNKISLKFKEFSVNLIYGGRKKILIDMTYTDFMDSSFLGAIINLVRLAKAQGGEVKVVMQSHIQENVSNITRLDKIFTIYQDVESALNDFIKEGSI